MLPDHLEHIYLPLGSRLINGRIEIVESEIEGDREIPADIRTSKIFLQIANSVSFLKLTVEKTGGQIRPYNYPWSGIKWHNIGVYFVSMIVI